MPKQENLGKRSNTREELSGIFDDSHRASKRQKTYEIKVEETNEEKKDGTAEDKKKKKVTE